jgi:hypothetical protein
MEGDMTIDLTVQQLEKLRMLVLEKVGSGNVPVSRHFWEALVIRLHAAIEDAPRTPHELIH